MSSGVRDRGSNRNGREEVRAAFRVCTLAISQVNRRRFFFLGLVSSLVVEDLPFIVLWIMDDSLTIRYLRRGGRTRKLDCLRRWKWSTSSCIRTREVTSDGE